MRFFVGAILSLSTLDVGAVGLVFVVGKIGTLRCSQFRWFVLL